MKEVLKNFLVPTSPSAVQTVFEPNVSAVVPTYKPGATAFRLVEDLLAYNPRLTVVVVDDCTPHEYRESHEVLDKLRTLGGRVVVLRTPENRLKAGALNLGLSHLLGSKGPHTPAVIVTLDDDVVIEPTTISRMTEALLRNPGLGAVCSACRVLNNHANLLTRLQGLEYVGFNAIRLSDQGFMRGPLVMHGMLTAFRARALRQAGPFAQGHLIEDYEMTTRLKSLGWHVQAVLGARAATEVPETLRHFWRQRVRWSLGGVQVVLHARDKTAVLQDVLGHSAFLSTLAVLMLALVLPYQGSMPPILARIIISISCIQLISWYGFSLWLMRWYKEKDAWDYLLRLTLLPELLYSNIMTLVLVGSYLFMVFSYLRGYLARTGRVGVWITRVLDGAFSKLGYAQVWGTRST